ncbi:MAG: hypothetical protein R3A52_31255 [Polyangiales bacterium]
MTYVSSRGESWYLHEGVTKTGKPRYFVARSVGAGALAAMPEGREFRESINGVVSVARVDASAPRVDPADLAALQAEVKKHRQLARHKVAELKGALVLHEPHGLGSMEMSAFATIFGLDPEALSGLPVTRVRYTPVLKFVTNPDAGTWSVYRWVSLGEGFWHWLGHGKLLTLAREYLPAVGTDEFFELL